MKLIYKKYWVFLNNSVCQIQKFCCKVQSKNCFIDEKLFAAKDCFTAEKCFAAEACFAVQPVCPDYPNYPIILPGLRGVLRLRGVLGVLLGDVVLVLCKNYHFRLLLQNSDYKLLLIFKHT